MNHFLKKIKLVVNAHHILLWSIIGLGAMLRYYSFAGMPFVHDELSAISRLSFDSFADLMEYGVKVDGHPALIQVFLYYYSAIFGLTEWVIKLPFFLMGIGSIWLTYVNGKAWFSSAVGLLSATCMATLQFSITYSLIARPYISGLFICLIYTYYWHQIILKSNDTNRVYLGLIITGVLASYNHYFSLLFIGIAGITGLIVIEKKKQVSFLISQTIIGLVFLPFVPIFFHQLSLGGLAWLAPVGWDFIFRHIGFVFHFQWMFLVSIITAIIIFGFVTKNYKVTLKKPWIISFIWFILPLVIGILYSTYRKPVLQHSMLLFTLPFLFFWLFGMLQNLSKKWTTLLVFILVIVNGASLVFSRNHFNLIQKNPFFSYTKVNSDLIQNGPVVLSEKPQYLDFYWNNNNYISLYDSTVIPWEYMEWLDVNRFKKLTLGQSSPLLRYITQQHYSSFHTHMQGVNFALTTFTNSSTKPNKAIFQITRFITHNEFDQFHALGKNQHAIPVKEEWGPAVTIESLSFLPSRHFTLGAHVDIKDSIAPNAHLVIACYHKDELIAWSGSKFSDFIPPKTTNKWHTVYNAINLNPVIGYMPSRDIKVKVYVWNNGKKSLLFKDLDIHILTGNPYEYASIEPI